MAHTNTHTERTSAHKKGTKMRTWAKAAAIRALKTVAQTAVATIGTI